MRDIENLTVAVVGATGAVGREMLAVLEQRGFQLANIRLFASKKSAGSRQSFNGRDVLVEELNETCFKGVDIALFSAGSRVSAEFGPIAAKSGTVVVDNSSYFRMNEDVPLTVPEVNAHSLKELIRGMSHEEGLIIANPNCSTIQMVVVLKPLLEQAGLRRVVVSTYQSVSGAGKLAMDELWNQTMAIMNQREISQKVFPHRIAFNCIPHIDTFLDNGYTKEEMKVVNETRKILALPELLITATAVRVPVFSCHSESVNVETERPLSPEDARELLRKSPGVIVVDDPGESIYPLSSDIVGTDATYVGRIRRDFSVENGLNMWIVADNLRKGAALNAVQIAELVVDTWSRRQ